MADRRLRGYTVTRRVVGEHYPRNGNVWNPTKRYVYTVTAPDGLRVGSADTLRGCRELIEIDEDERAHASARRWKGRPT